jgi:arylsulfatase
MAANSQTEGVLYATGGIYGGFTFFIKDGKLWYDYNAFNEAHYVAVSDRTIPSGDVELKALYTADQKNMTGVVELFINGEKDMGAPVSKEYDRDNEFRGGVLDRVVVEIL